MGRLTKVGGFEWSVREEGRAAVNGNADLLNGQRGTRRLARDPAEFAVLAGLGVERVGELVREGQGGRDGKRPDQQPSGQDSATGGVRSGCSTPECRSVSRHDPETTRIVAAKEGGRIDDAPRRSMCGFRHEYPPIPVPIRFAPNGIRG